MRQAVKVHHRFHPHVCMATLRQVQQCRKRIWKVPLINLHAQIRCSALSDAGVLMQLGRVATAPTHALVTVQVWA